MSTLSRLAAAAAVALFAAGPLACASSAGIRSAAPLEGKAGFEAAGSGSVHGGPAASGASVGAYGRVAFSDIVEVGAWGHGGAAAGYPSLIERRGFGGIGYGGHGAGGGVFGRARYRLFPALSLGFGAFAEASDETFGPAPRRRIGGGVSVPVAERIVEGLWIYARPGASVFFTLIDEDTTPFPVAGNVECPIGVSWVIANHLVLVVEGGFFSPTNGVIFSAALGGRFDVVDAWDQLNARWAK